MHTWCSIRYKHADLFTSLSGYAAGICNGVCVGVCLKIPSNYKTVCQWL